MIPALMLLAALAAAPQGWSATCQRGNGMCTAQACGRTPDSAKNRCALLCAGEAQTIEIGQTQQCAAHPGLSRSPADVYPRPVKASDPVASAANAGLARSPGFTSVKAP